MTHSRKKQPKHRNKSDGKRSVSRPISATRRRVYSFLLVLIPIFFLILLEILLRIMGYGGNMALFVPTPYEDSPYLGINVNVCRRYFSLENFVPTPRKDIFLKEKPENGFRIFVLGGSTTAGFPYGNNLTFPRILHRRLCDTFPEKRIEVVNMAMTAINSYTMLDFLDEILCQDPDLLLIYAGHNEYFGAMGVASMESLGRNRFFVRLALRFQRYKTYLLIQNSIRSFLHTVGQRFTKTTENDPMKTMMSRIARDQSIPYGSPVYQQGKRQFESNMRDILKKATDVGLPVVLSELVSNVRDQAPFGSDRSGPSASEIFQKARILEKNGRYKEARIAYYHAKDLDVIRFRAAEDINNVIKTLAGEFSLPIVPMRAVFESASPHGLIGKSLMYEHLHPRRSGYFLMADAIYSTLRNNGMVEPQWPEEELPSLQTYARTWGFTALDSTFAALTIHHLRGGWPFQDEYCPNLALQSFQAATIQDSIVLEILMKNKMTLEQGHMHLAKLLEGRGEYESAFKEYRALIYTVPYLDLFYEMTLEYLLRHKQVSLIFEVLKDGIRYNPSPVMQKWLGQAHLLRGQTNTGIQILERVLEKRPNDPQILENLIRAFYSQHLFDKGDIYLRKLQRIDSSLPVLKQLSQFRNDKKTQSISR